MNREYVYIIEKDKFKSDKKIEELFNKDEKKGQKTIKKLNKLNKAY